MSAIAGLFRSFEDLWVHADSVEAAWFGETVRPGLDQFDAESGRQHAAAFRALGVALEELDSESLDFEVDRTLLLGAIRTRQQRLEHERPGRNNPALWCHRLATVVRERPGEPDVLVRIPAWVASLQETLKKPPLIHLQVALDYVAQAAASLQTEHWWQSDKDALSRAVSSLEVLDRFLRHEVEPDPEPLAGSLGADRTEWRLKHEHLIELSGGEALRRLGARLERVNSGAVLGPATDGTGVPAAGSGTSELRARLTHPAWRRAWLLFTAALEGGGEPGQAIAAQLRVGVLDLAIQLGQVPVAEAAGRLAESAEDPATTARLVVAPLTEAATALLVEAWEGARQASPLDDASFVTAVNATGLFHPVLAGWRLGAA